MPTYEYECLNCGTYFEAFQKMSDSRLDKCVECQGAVRRVVSGGSGLIFKGSGFYITDYADKNKSKSTQKKSDNTPSKTKNTSDSKGDKKAAPKKT